MNNDVNLLITLSNGEYLHRVALKARPDNFTGDCLECPLEPENKQQIARLLPKHVQSAGHIVEVEQIFEISRVPQMAGQA